MCDGGHLRQDSGSMRVNCLTTSRSPAAIGLDLANFFRGGDPFSGGDARNVGDVVRFLVTEVPTSGFLAEL